MALTTTPRRSARLGSHCSRKRAWVPDSDQVAPPSSKLPPEPSPRWIRAQKRQKILDGASLPSDSKATPGKRKSLVAADEQHHHRVVGKKRKENILNGAAAKISITVDTRQGSGNNLHRSQSRRNTRSSASSAPDSKSNKSVNDVEVPEPLCDPSSSRMVTRTVKELSTDLNMPISTYISTTLAPSESELGFGFHPQEGFNTTGPEEGKGNKDGEGEFMNGERLQTNIPTAFSLDLSPHSHSLNRPSSPPSLSLQSCTPCLIPVSTTPTPPRLAISTSEAQPISTSPIPSTSPASYSSYPTFANPTSPTYSSPLKAVCFPSLPGPPPQSFPSTSHWQPSPSPSPSHQPSLPHSAPMSAYERRMKEWDTMAIDMANDQRHSERALEQEMSMELSLSFTSSSADELRQGKELEEQDRSPLLGPAPQPSPPQQPAPYPPLAPSLPSCSPPPCSSTPCPPSTSSRQYHKKIEYQHHQMPEWTPKLDKERSLWKLACKIRVWEITKRYTPDTIRTVVAQEAHDYYSAHGFPLGYGSVPVKPRKRRWRKMATGSGLATAAATAGSESDCASSCSSMMVTTPSLSPSTREDEFMNEETYSFELMDDDDDMDISTGGVGLGITGMRSMEDEWRYEGFEDGDEFGFDDYDDDDDDDDDDIYEDEVDVEEVDQAKIPGNRKKKGPQSITTGEDQDPDAEGEMEIDIEPFQDPSFNAELSSPTSSSSASSKSKSKSKSIAIVGDESQSFVSSFYVPPVPPHVQHVMQMQQQQQQRQEAQQQLEEPVLAPLSPSLSSTTGTPISTSSDTADHTSATSNNHTPMQIHLPPAPHHPHHFHSQLSSNILPLPPPRLDSVRVFILRQAEMGGLKTTGRGTPADRKRGAIWGGIGGQVIESRSKRGLDVGKESEGEGGDEENGGDEGGKRGRQRLRLMLSDHDMGSGPRRGHSRQGDEESGAKMALRLSLPCDTDERMPIIPTGFKCDISESGNANNDEDIHRIIHKPSSSSTFVATDPTWDAFLASLDDKSQPQQQGEEGRLDSSVIAADSDTPHGQQLLLDLDGRHRSERDPLGSSTVRRLGPSSPTLEGSGGMFIFDQGGDNSSSPWFEGADGVSEGGLGKSGVSVGVGVGGLVGSSGTCPSDALALEEFNFPVGSDGSSTLSYALG